MSMITWKNVGTTVSGGSGTDLMESAQKTLDGAFKSATDLLDQQKTAMKEGFERSQDNLMADYLDHVARADTVEGVAALKDDEVLANLRSQLTGDRRNTIRGAELEQERNIIQNASLRMDHEDKTRTRDELPIVNEYRTLMSRGQYGAAQELLDKHNLMNGGELALEGRKLLQDDKRFEWDEAAHGMRLAADRRSAEAHNRQMKAYDDAEKERARLEGLESEALDLMRRLFDEASEQDAMTNEIAIQFGAVNPETGEIDTSLLGLEDTQEFLAALERNGLSEDVNSTQAVRDWVLNNPDVKNPAELRALMQGVGGGFNDMLQLAPREQAEFDRDLATVENYWTKEEERLREEDENYKATNIFAEPVALTSDRLSEVAQTLWSDSEINAVLQKSTQADMERYIRELTVIGHEVAPNVNITLHPGLISSFIREHAKSWFRTEDQMRENLGNWITRNAKLIQDAEDHKAKQAARAEEIAKGMMQGMSAVVSQHQKNANIPQGQGATLHQELTRRAAELEAAEARANAERTVSAIQEALNTP